MNVAFKNHLLANDLIVNSLIVSPDDTLTRATTREILKAVKEVKRLKFLNNRLVLRARSAPIDIFRGKNFQELGQLR